MKLEQLIAPLLLKQVVGTLGSVEISHLTDDSRQVRSGSVFVALRGYTHDGHNYIRKVVDQGAQAVIVEEQQAGIEAIQVVVPSTRAAIPILASVFYGHPTQTMKVIGVTGTNGKTTTTHLIDAILMDAGFRTGLIGTVKKRIGDTVYDVNNTTPEALDLQATFHEMKHLDTEYVVMEVSSHAVELLRVAGTRFRTALFTNLTQDHLDYHGTMENYRLAKGKFFSQLGNTYADDPEQVQYAIVNTDDPSADFFLAQTVAQKITYGIDNDADVRATHVQITAQGARFDVDTFVGSTTVQLQMTGKFSVYNALAAMTACLCEGISLEAIKTSLEKVAGVDGRFEQVQAGQPYSVIVDYAHTPDSLENVLKTIREFAKGNVYTIVGCGGDRDRSKRPKMAQIAAYYSDIAVITSDNPRTEDPDSILDDMEMGLVDVPKEEYVRLVDRTEAIRYAIEHAKPDDVILIAGKGHETYQIIGTTKYHYDDREVARELIQEARGDE